MKTFHGVNSFLLKEKRFLIDTSPSLTNAILKALWTAYITMCIEVRHRSC